MIENSNSSLRSTHASKLINDHSGSEVCKTKAVRGWNETLEEKPLLKQYFYDFLVMNNNRYKIFAREDVNLFEKQRYKIQRKATNVYFGMSFSFAALYLMCFGVKRKSSVWTHNFKLFSVVFLLPAIPANILSIQLSTKDRQQLLEIAEKYPIQDEKLFRDFIIYALPNLKDKYLEELDKKKEEDGSE